VPARLSYRRSPDRSAAECWPPIWDSEQVQFLGKQERQRTPPLADLLLMPSELEPSAGRAGAMACKPLRRTRVAPSRAETDGPGSLPVRDVDAMATVLSLLKDRPRLEPCAIAQNRAVPLLLHAGSPYVAIREFWETRIRDGIAVRRLQLAGSAANVGVNPSSSRPVTS